MEIFHSHSFVWATVMAVVIFIIFGSFSIKASVALDVLNTKLRVQIALFGLTIISILIYYQDCAIYIKTPKGKPKELTLKPVTKFETKFGINVARIIADKNIYVNTLLGIDCNAYTTSLIAGALLTLGGITAAVFNASKKSKLNLNINETQAENKGKIFLRFKFKTSIAKVFLALLESI